MSSRANEIINAPMVSKYARIEDVTGHYVVFGNRFVDGFTLLERNVVPVDSSMRHCLGVCSKSHGISDRPSKLDTDPIAVRIYLSDISSPIRFVFRILPGYPIDEHVYTIVFHQNGVVRFVVNPNLPNRYKLLWGYFDSQSLVDFIWNLKHARSYGCFCMGVLLTNGNILRYNRWNEDCVRFASFIKAPPYFQ
jgi:hypothetical protein